MSPEWLTAIGTLGTFVVIAASAIAALMQLRHMRGSNQIIALTELRETVESEAFQAARRFVSSDFAQLLKDPENRKRLLAGTASGAAPAEFEPVAMVARFFENMGALVRQGIIDRDIACDLWAPVVIGNWDRLSPWIMSLRRLTQTPSYYENFEYLTVIAQQWMAEHPSGSYPPNLRRLEGDVWPEASPAHES